ncbi:MAG: tetraacyldisaccharide 4'-kinase [Gemmatimonadaceae bacterium]|nr:tetraacyldisaccharide 4'-kinase [Gemmatimonadaceae bacterium]
MSRSGATSAGGRQFAEWVWYSPSVGAGLVRTLLRPLSMLFGVGVRRRNAQYDAQLKTTGIPPLALPALSIGNLTVGGTGKTPVAAWFAERLFERGGRPALLLRGYGEDEWQVHRQLNPLVEVVLNPDRVAGAEEASHRGADCLVLDDGFQHRRARRVADVVLVSADRFTGRPYLLPAGPYREPLTALQRATAVVVTVKAAREEQVEATLEAIRQAAPQVGVAVVRLVPGGLNQVAADAPHSKDSPKLPWSALAGASVVLVSAIADPSALAAQVQAAGATVVADLRFGDHHDFTVGDVGRILERAAQSVMIPGITPTAPLVVCTLKDAVKLSPLWPRAGTALWYVSQHVAVERGADLLDKQLSQVLAARGAAVPTAG